MAALKSIAAGQVYPEYTVGFNTQCSEASWGPTWRGDASQMSYHRTEDRQAGLMAHGCVIPHIRNTVPDDNLQIPPPSHHLFPSPAFPVRPNWYPISLKL